MVKILYKKSYRLSSLKLIKYDSLWGKKGIFSTIRVCGKKPKLILINSHIKNMNLALAKMNINFVISKKINSFNGFIALGCVIKGKTPHFSFISQSTINALMDLSIKYKKPIGNGIVTSLNTKQAYERSDPSRKNKGGEAAKAVLSVLDII